MKDLMVQQMQGAFQVSGGCIRGLKVRVGEVVLQGYNPDPAAEPPTLTLHLPGGGSRRRLGILCTGMQGLGRRFPSHIPIPILIPSPAQETDPARVAEAILQAC